MNNPYSWNRINLDLIYGRDRLLNEFLSGLPGSNRSSYGLTAGRRMGKTTMLRAIELELKRSADMWSKSGLLIVPAYVDGLALPRPLTLSNIWTTIFAAIQTSVGQPERPIADFADFVACCRELIRSRREAVRVIVLIDEIEHVLACDWADGFFANWRALLTNMPELSANFTAVFSGAQELARLKVDIGSPLMDVLEWRVLTPLGFDDALRLIEEPTNRHESEVVIRTIFDETGGHPMLLQYVMQQVCRIAGPASEQTVREVADEFIKDRGWQFAEWWNKHCSEVAQRIYLRLSFDRWTTLRDLVLEFGTKSANDSVEILQHVGLIESDEDGLKLRRLGRMFSRWQQQFGTLVGSGGFDAEVAARLRLLDSALSAKYLAAWGILASDLPNYSGAVSECRDVITHVLHMLAPDADVTTELGFRFEAGQSTPTRRQRARYVARARDLSSEQGKTVGSEVELLEARSNQVALLVGGGYAVASALTHTTATRELAYQALRLADSVLLQLLPHHA